MPVIPQTPLSPEGGSSPLVGVRLPRKELVELNAELSKMNVTRSEFFRRCLRYGLDHADVILGVDAQQEVAKAS